MASANIPPQLSFRLGGTRVSDFANSTELNPSVIETPRGKLRFGNAWVYYLRLNRGLDGSE
jgi:hypothetical protein